MVAQVLPSEVILHALTLYYGLGHLSNFPVVVTNLFTKLKNQESITHLPRNFSQIAPHLKHLFSTIQGIYFLTIVIKPTIDFVSQLLPFIPSPFSNQIDINQALLNTKTTLDKKFDDWTRILQQNSSDNYQALKNGVALQCKELTALLQKIRSQSIIGTPEVQLNSLKMLRDKLDPVLTKLASMNLSTEDKEDGEENNLPFMKLSYRGFRDLDWTSVARQMGWNPEDSVFLPLKFAEMKVFSINDLRDKKVLDEEYPSTDQEVSALIQVLKGQSVSHQADPRWEFFMKIVHTIDRFVARIFAFAFHSLVILTSFYAGFNWSRSHLLKAIDEGWTGFHIRHSASMFVEGDAMSRWTWIFTACSPMYTLANATTYAIKHHGFRSIPRILYQTYFS